MYHRRLSLETAPDFIVIANGEFPTLELLHKILQRAYDKGTVVCCDGAVHKILKAGFPMPHLIVGDLDSLAQEWKDMYRDILIEIKEQDTNDLSKTFRVIAERYSPDRVLLLGATGLREDHMMGNISLLPTLQTFLSGETKELITASNYGCFYVQCKDMRNTYESLPGQQISLFAMAPGVKFDTEGLHWPLNESTLEELWMGTLNRAENDTFEVTATKGNALVYIAHEVRQPK